MKPLKFIHITKSAGTSMEDLAAKQNIKWGRHHREYGFWHDYFSDKSHKLKQAYDWFMVVRNPYGRVISEYNWINSNEKRSIRNEPRGCIVNDFNEFISEKLRIISENKQLKEPLRKGHFNKQSRYLDSSVSITVLKFENIEVEFNKLMKLYNLNLILNAHKNKIPSDLTYKDINNANMALINEVYKEDFALFGYKMLESEEEEYNVEEFMPLPKFSEKNIRSVYDLENSLVKNEK